MFILLVLSTIRCTNSEPLCVSSNFACALDVFNTIFDMDLRGVADSSEVRLIVKEEEGWVEKRLTSMVLNLIPKHLPRKHMILVFHVFLIIIIALFLEFIFSCS